MLKKLQKLKSIAPKIMVAAILAASGLTASAQTTPVEAWGQLKVVGKDLQTQDGKNVQLRGMSLGWSSHKTEAGPFFSASAIKSLAKNWKCTVVRAPLGVHPASVGDTYNKGYEEDPSQANMVKTVIDAAIAEGIYVVVDFHAHDAEKYVQQATTFFDDISKTYGGKPNVIYEIFNEPLEQAWGSVIKPYHETLINVIRKNDPDNIIICGTRFYSQQVDLVIPDPIKNQTNIMYTIHFYANSTWEGKLSHAIDGDDVGKRTKAGVAAGIPIFVTEYGTVEASGAGAPNEAETKKWYDYMDANNISYIGWQINTKAEGSSAITSAGIDGPTTASGTIMKNMLIAKAPKDLTPLKPTATNNGYEYNTTLAYPNPFNNSLTITEAGNFTFTITDMAGKALLSGKGVDSQEITTDLNNGSYILTVESAKGKKVSKLVKN